MAECRQSGSIDKWLNAVIVQVVPVSPGRLLKSCFKIGLTMPIIDSRAVDCEGRGCRS